MDEAVQQPPQRLSSLTAWPVFPAGTPAYFRYWGKARKEEESGPPCHLLPYHCLDVAAVAVEYLRRHQTLREHFKALLKIESDEHLYGWIAFWMALHDLGKFSEAFQRQREDLLSRFKERAPQRDKAYTVRHDSLGMLFWNKRLLAELTRNGCFDDDFDREDGLNAWARAVTGHHGQPPQEIDKAWTFFFDEQDAAAILDFAGEMRRLFLRDGVSGIPTLQGGNAFRLASMELSWWVAGLAVMADWIGSNAEVFTYCAEPAPSLDAYWERARRLAVLALDDSGVLPVESHGELSFDKLFPSIATPSPLQDWAAKMPLSDGPQIHILEDVTGAGKTEAAVMLVHRLMAAGAADGFFIGLPTMATANAMYGRIAHVYATLFDGIASLTLPHGKSSLVEEFAASVVRPGQEERDDRQKDDTATARCTAWLADHRKRALLAPAGVGTIDQALLGALQSRHQSLRLLGLFRKVLVVDEVHACDAYMQGVLEMLLRLHAQAEGSAVLLSATLPQAMKQSLLKAFAQGCGLQQAPPVEKDDFPLVTSWNPSQPERLDEEPITTRPDVSRTVEFRFLSSQDAVIEKIEQALAAGRCVAWIRNTVADAMEAHQLFASKLPPEKLLLFHARFALGDRLAMETQVLKCFGPRSTPDDRRGRLLICTQVAEQSLDIDMDVLVTDLAPMDRVLQRTGRLRRHVRDANGQRLTEPEAKDGRGTPCVLVYGPQWTDRPASTWVKQAFPKAWRVYPHHGELWLTARLLQDVAVSFPTQARGLVEGVFGSDQDVPEGLRGNANAAEGQRYGDISLARENCVKPGGGYARSVTDWLEDAKTPSRLGEDTKEVLLACWEGDELRPWFPHEKRRHAWAYSSVRMAARQIAEVPDPVSPKRLAALNAAKESLPGKGRWVVVLPLELVNGRWVGQALGAPPNEKQPGRLRTWRYDEQMGLLAEETPDGSPSGA
ncbi:CRISPR-associated helicase/endonuclease Cas3 [Azohydromonas lata]|uniref:CRISPR-associated helicase/endonuclease Cas3 n=1 Tax=Azohydromonas lata TaxID=45677 RepID=UPI00082F2749|nr:CRISPR-associated helicase/endonuclease Cas3 [Azohydromonas lata]